MEVDGHVIRTVKSLSVILQDRIGHITLAMIATTAVTGTDYQQETSRLLRPTQASAGRLRQARDLFAKVDLAHFYN